MTSRTKVALWLLISPTALLITTFILFAGVNFLFILLAPMPADGEAVSTAPIGSTIVNIILFVFGTIGVISWLPGLITGIVLLATKK
jgi:hypothetical protein